MHLVSPQDMYLDLQTMSTLFESGSKRLGFNFSRMPSSIRGHYKNTFYGDENDNDDDDEGGKGWFVNRGDMHLSTGGRTKKA